MKPPQRPTGLFGFLAAPPTLARTLARAHVSCALAQRVELEREALAPGDMQPLLDAALAWLQERGAHLELEPAEHAALAALPGRLEPALAEAFAPRAEAAAVIGWALQRCGIPPFDVDADAAGVAAALGWLGDDGEAGIGSVRLRERGEITTYLDIVSAVHWRLRRQLEEPGPVSMARWSTAAMSWPPAVAPIELQDEEFALGGIAVPALAPAALLAALLRVRERHRAALWLLGQAQRYSQVELGG